jgi:hypothetical protein
MPIQRVGDKWAKTRLLLDHSGLKDLVPETKRMNSSTLRSMLDTYKHVYVKPIHGTFGIGVMRVMKTADGYQFQHGTNLYKYRSYEALYDAISRSVRRPSYLVQKGIDLLKYKKRKFDLRVMVQRNPNGAWESTGIIGRLGHPKKIVTNFHNGGTLMEPGTLLSPYLNMEQRTALLEKLKKIGVQVGNHFQTRYPQLKELGLDIALDQTFKPWILEVNTMPDPFIFRKLKDKSIFRKVYRYAAAYGRFKSRTRKARRKA